MTSHYHKCTSQHQHQHWTQLWATVSGIRDVFPVSSPINQSISMIETLTVSDFFFAYFPLRGKSMSIRWQHVIIMPMKTSSRSYLFNFLQLVMTIGRCLNLRGGSDTNITYWFTVLKWCMVKGLSKPCTFATEILLTMSAWSRMDSISWFDLSLHSTFRKRGPQIFLTILLSKTLMGCSSALLKGQVLVPYVTTNLMGILCNLIVVPLERRWPKQFSEAKICTIPCHYSPGYLFIYRSGIHHNKICTVPTKWQFHGDSDGGCSWCCFLVFTIH